MIIYFDGGCVPNPGKMTICVVISGESDSPEIHTMNDLGNGTNNIAEWASLCLAARLIQDRDFKEIIFKGDSRLVVNQVNKVYRMKAEHLMPFKKEFDTLMKGIKYSIRWIPREENLAGIYLETGKL